jgi:hypothetical protein
MNQSINNHASEIRELSPDELDSVSGGRISFGPVYIDTWKDGAFEIGLKGVGGLLVSPEGIGLCPENGTCATVKL